MGAPIIKATKMIDESGREGFFITKKDWHQLQQILSARIKPKKSLMPGMRQALKEVRADLLGKKSLPSV